MIDPSMVEVVTVDERYPTVEALQRKVVELESNLKTATDNWDYVRKNLSETRSQIAQLETYVKENHEYIADEVIEEITNIFGFSLTHEYDVTITVRWSGTVVAPIDYDMDDLSDALNISLDTAWQSSDIEVDVSEDDTDIEWSQS
jgi:hypothetical protein